MIILVELRVLGLEEEEEAVVEEKGMRFSVGRDRRRRGWYRL